METSTILKEQESIAKSIERLRTNFKKDGPSRWNAPYLENKVKELNSYWMQFVINNATLTSQLPGSHPYVQHNLYQETKTVYEDFMQKIKNRPEFEKDSNSETDDTPPSDAGLLRPSKLSSTMESVTVTSESSSDIILHPTTTTPVVTQAVYTGTIPRQYDKVATTSNNAVTTTSSRWNQPITTTEHPLNTTTPTWNLPFTTKGVNTVPNNPPFMGNVNTWPSWASYGVQPATSIYNPGQYLPPYGQFGEQQCHLPAWQKTHLPKLPPVQIPKFNGIYKDWYKFYDVFKSVIHDNYNLGNVTKFQYLLSYLEGEAATLVSTLRLSDANYIAALEILEERYKNPRRIITSYLDIVVDHKKLEHRVAEDLSSLHGAIRECLTGLANMGYKTNEWEAIIVHIAMKKLDNETQRLFDESLDSAKIMPTLKELLEFLMKRHHNVLNFSKGKKSAKPEAATNSTNKKTFHSTVQSCGMCKEQHSITKCDKFKALSTFNRKKTADKLSLCVNCLMHKRAEKCYSKKTCYECQGQHHTLLHYQKKAKGDQQHKNTNETDSATTNVEEVKSLAIRKEHTVMLATALVKVKTTSGRTELLRALVDPGSQASFITEDAAQSLHLKKTRINASISGIGETTASTSRYKVQITIGPRFPSSFAIGISAFVLPKITNSLPERAIQLQGEENYGNNILADPTYMTPGPIDLLLGADVYTDILENDLKKGKDGHPTMQKTKLGWTLIGKISNKSESTQILSMISTTEWDQQLRQFWDMDDCAPKKALEDDFCEQHFVKTTTKTNEGRYVVELPFKHTNQQLGNSKLRALARLYQMENRFNREPHLRDDYNKFLQEYLDLGHMTQVQPFRGPDSKVFYLPHHAVLKEDSTTTKLRVVFDASAQSESGSSLNDLLESGPKIQDDLMEILMRWRKFRYVYTADVEKMFRQVLVAEKHQDFQRIFWRSDPTKPVKEYRLNTVTYGTAPATFLAVRALKQLATDHNDEFPLAAQVLQTHFYVDDMLTGCDTKEEAIVLQQQILQLLQLGGFNLRKWTSNSQALLENIPENQRETGICEISPETKIKALGLFWNPAKDEFSYNFSTFEQNKLSKRQLLSNVASIYDPLGFLAPVTVTAKILIQEAWRHEKDWDKELPEDIRKAWNAFNDELHYINNIQVPRWIHHRNSEVTEIHGFCDASLKAYGAAVYARTVSPTGVITTTLIVAKTRVTPKKMNTVTLPRLELCSALLLAQLLQTTRRILDLTNPPTYAWSDSKITIAWIQKRPEKWNDFVAWRIRRIQELTSPCIWHHVSTNDNPADAASRGIPPKRLKTHPLWWHGPEWLSQPKESWPMHKENEETNEEKAVETTALVTEVDTKDMLCRFSNFKKLQRTTAYCQRFIDNCKAARERKIQNLKRGPLSVEELKTARCKIISMMQEAAFPEELGALRSGKTLRNTSKILSLNPQLDENGLIRVGGRLQKSVLEEDQKHPILLPKDHVVTKMIIRDAHINTMHGGTLLTTNYIRQTYWIVSAKSVVQGIIRQCMVCFRLRKRLSGQLMGSLPSKRVTPSPPFSYTGVDFAGPFLTLPSKRRGNTVMKSYIALFICMCTKAIHLELVSDLSTDAFLAAYKRFTARRGHCVEITSDNGTNFVGAHKRLDKEFGEAIKQATETAAELLANDGVAWKFIPPASPHFGGLWEAGVKSVKSHLKRVLGDTRLSFEEFSTVLAQVEALVNSRPIGELSRDPSDYEALTPGHFLTGRPLTAPPEPRIMEENPHIRWKTVTKLQQNLWDRWSKEYLHLLQQRNKWRKEQDNLKEGELVLIMEENLPPSKWALGRITKLHPGSDGKVRVVTVKFRGHEKNRPVHKLCQLPMNIYDQNSALPASNEDSPSGSNYNTKNSSTEAPTNTIDKEEKPRESKRLRKKKAFSVLTNPKKKTRIAPCTWATTILHAVLMFFMLFSTILATSNNPDKPNIEVFVPDPGLYIEKMGIARLQRGNLQVEITYTTAEFQRDQELINAIWDKMSLACKTASEAVSDADTTCTHNINHLQHKRDYLLEEINRIAENKVARKKRGLLGQAMTYLFGVNDQVYASIDQLKERQEDVQKLIKQQSLMLSTKVDLSNTIIENKLQKFDDKITQINEAIDEMANWYVGIDHNRVRIDILTTYINAADCYEEFERKLTNIQLAKDGKLDLHSLVTGRTLQDTIQSTLRHIGPDFDIPRRQREPSDYIFRDGELVIFGKFPILEKDEFHLIHITPIPVAVENGTFIVPEVEANIMGIDFNKQIYFTLEDGHNQCSSIGSGKYYCTLSLLHNMDQNPNCVIDEIYHRHPKTKCEMIVVRLEGTLWKRLAMENMWLFITSQPTSVAVICMGHREEKLLKNAGILRVKEGCVIKTKKQTLHSTMEHHMKASATYIKPLEFAVKESSGLRKIAIIDPKPIINGQNLFHQAKNVEVPEPPTYGEVITHPVVSSGSVIFIIGLLCWISRKQWKKLWSRCHKPKETLAEKFGKLRISDPVHTAPAQDVHT